MDCGGGFIPLRSCCATAKYGAVTLGFPSEHGAVLLAPFRPARLTMEHPSHGASMRSNRVSAIFDLTGDRAGCRMPFCRAAKPLGAA